MVCAGENGEVVYSLEVSTEAQYGHLFSLDSANGTLTLRQSLDRETQAQYLLTVIATDRGQSPSSAHATVTTHSKFPLFLIEICHIVVKVIV